MFLLIYTDWQAASGHRIIKANRVIGLKWLWRIGVNQVPVVSLDTAALLTDTSKRTLWRHLSAGKLQRHSVDEQGRVMLALTELTNKLCVKLSTSSGGGGAGDDFSLLVSADRGDSAAQSELALLFMEQERPDLAAYWFQLAAQQQHADAMHYLSDLYQQGLGVEQSANQAMLWRVKAASAGHLIAQAQMAAITGSDAKE